MRLRRRARLYGIPLSHPTITASLALDHKGVPYRRRMLLGGFHPLQLRLVGFRGDTVPALRLGRRRIVGTLPIVQALEAVPGPSLYPSDPVRREAVLAAERWGESVLQPVPRRLIRRALTRSYRVRVWFADVATPLPLPRVNAVFLAPVARLFAALVGASRRQTKKDRAGIDAMLDRVDALIADGVIGGDVPNAADFQIAPTVRMLGAFTSLRDQVAAHAPADALARRLVPEYPDVPA